VRSTAIVRHKRVHHRKRRKPTGYIRIGYILYETDSIVVIATLKSKNRKTGRMVQVWILNRKISPIDAVHTGADAAICFDCKHRGNGFQKRTCYVNVRSPQAIWKAYKRRRYQYLRPDQYTEAFSDKKIRFGAYGEPILIPIEIMAALTSVAPGWTGYTHQWHRPEYQACQRYLMASCDSARDATDAIGAGWRYFRVRSQSEAILPGEISCPASEEMGHRTTCARCQLCNGARGESDIRKNITLLVHGPGAKNFVPLTAIATAA